MPEVTIKARLLFRGNLAAAEFVNGFYKNLYYHKNSKATFPLKNINPKYQR